MDRIRRLHNPVQRYDWGSRSFLADFRGETSPSAEPEAELWMGAHPSAPSGVDAADGSRVPLNEWIARDPQACLGGASRERFGDELPFLLKVLAPARALSIQTHPDAQRARRGFARENAAGIALDARERSYRDPHPKPELVCSLTGFRALCGLRPRAEAAAWIDALGIAELREWALPLRGNDADAYRHFLAAALGADKARAAALARDAAEVARKLAPSGTHAAATEREAAFALVVELAEHYPGDLGILAPLFLRHLELAPEEALFLESGTLHAYLGGAAVELMANSDNVLRCGLTSKHVDVPELLEVLRPDEGGVPVRRPEPHDAAAGQLQVYASETTYFRLARLALTAGEAFEANDDHGPEIWLCSEGAARVVDGGGGRIAIERGQAVWVPAAAGRYRVEGSRGAAQLFRAGLPL